MKIFGILRSRLIHPVTLTYEGQGFVLPPRGQTVEVEKDKLGALPKGVEFIERRRE